MKRLLILFACLISLGVQAQDQALTFRKTPAGSFVSFTPSAVRDTFLSIRTDGIANGMVFVWNSTTKKAHATSILGSLGSSISATSPIFYNSGTGVISSQAATATLVGHVTIGPQTFAGDKTINGTLTASTRISSEASSGAADIQVNYTGTGAIRATFIASANLVRLFDETNARNIFQYNPLTSATTMPSTFQAASLSISGGTSSQFLKADGSVDATTYAPLASPTFTGTVTAPTFIGALTGTASNATTWNNQPYTPTNPSSIINLMGYDSSTNSWRPTLASAAQSFLGLGSNAYTSTAYLPLTGGTLSGALNGAAGTFSGAVTSNAIDAAFVISGGTSSSRYLDISNIGATGRFGAESSAGGVIIAGSTAYDMAMTGSSGISFSGNGGTSLHARLSNTGVLSGTFSGSLIGNASTVTNGVYTTGNQTIAGLKTFSSTIGLTGGSALQIESGTTGYSVFLSANTGTATGSSTVYLPVNRTGVLAMASDYLPLTGGTLTGSLTGPSATLGSSTATNPFTIRTGAGESYIRFLNSDGSTYGDLERSVTGSGAIRITSPYFRVTGVLEADGGITGTTLSMSGVGKFGSALANSGDISTGLNIKQTSTTPTSGIYIERSGERSGYYMYIGGALDGLTFQRNFAGTKSDILALNRDGTITVSGAMSSNTSITVGTFIKTGNPTGGTATEMRFGELIYGANVTGVQSVQRVSLNGTVYYIPVWDSYLMP